MSSLIKESTITLIARGISFILALGTSIIISRVLGPSLRGVYSLTILIINVTSLLVMFGLGSANVYYGARSPDELATLTGNSIVAGLGLGLIGAFSIVLLTLTPFFRTYLLENNVEVSLLRSLVFVLPFIQLSLYVQEIIRASGNILRYNVIGVLNMVFNFLGLVVFVWWWELGVRGAVVAWSLATILNTLIIFWMALDATKWHVVFEWHKLMRSFSFGIRLYPGNIAQFLNYRLDVFLMGIFLLPIEIGWYVTATGLAEKLWEIPHAIRTVLLYQVAVSEDEKSIHNTSARVSRVIFALIGLMCLLLALISYPLINILYGADYRPAALALILLLPGIWVLSVGKLLAIHLAGSGYPEIGTMGAIISLVATLVLDLLLMPRLGIAGAAIATSVAYSVSTTVFIYFFLKKTGLTLKDTVMLRSADIRFLYQVFGNALQHHFPNIRCFGVSKNE